MTFKKIKNIFKLLTQIYRSDSFKYIHIYKNALTQSENKLNQSERTKYLLVVNLDGHGSL